MSDHESHEPAANGTRTDAGPLVSVICRSVDRPFLKTAINSVSAQTHRPLEIILVDAAGQAAMEFLPESLDVPLRTVSHGRPLRRPEAANAGLSEASGTFLLFLDDDDWLAAGHITGLVEALDNDPGAGVAYSNTILTDRRGEAAGTVFDIDWDPDRLRRDNFIPIHSALFRRQLVEKGCRFDERFDIFEDWDFWLQLAEHTHFIHCRQDSAFYRQDGDSDTASRDPSTRFQADHPIARGRERVFDKWLPHWDGARLNRILATLDQSARVEQLHDDIARLNQDNRKIRSDLRQVSHELDQARHKLNKRAAELQDTRARLQDREAYIEALRRSFSWRVTGPYRWLRRRLEHLIPLSAGHDDQTSTNQEPGAARILANIDVPGPSQREFSGALTIQGWCCAPSGIAHIEARVDGASLAEFEPRLPRPDIEACHPQLPEAGRSGFHHELTLTSLEAGQHRLELIIADRSGNRKRLSADFHLFQGNDLYNTWYWRNMPDEATLAELAEQARELADAPRFQLLIEAGNDPDQLWATLASISEQCYPWWHIHVIGGKALQEEVLLGHTNLEEGDNLTRHEKLPDLQGWQGCLRAGEQLAPHALWEFAQASADGADLMYSDHDHYESGGMHMTPCFTPGWSPDHLLASNYVGGFFLSRHPCSADAIRHGAAWRYAWLLEAGGQSVEIRRVPRMLWSRPQSPDSSADQQAETAVVRRHLEQRTNQEAGVETDAAGVRHLRYRPRGNPLVSIIIPTTGRADLARTCMNSIAERTAYSNHEVLVIDNSHGRNPEGINHLETLGFTLIECNEPFNWARFNNLGAAQAQGEFLLFLNDDIEITDEQWLHELVGQAQRRDIATVGARLLYPDGKLQHSGILLVNYGGGGIHLLRGHEPGDGIYRRLDLTQREVSASTGACLMVARSRFDEVDGFDEALAVVGNDVDFCLRLRERGYRNIWTPECTLVHHESVSRESRVPADDERHFWARWGRLLTAGDEYYNPNLSLEYGDFSLRTEHAAQPSPNRLGSCCGETPEDAGTPMPGVNLIGYIRAEMGIGEGARSDARALDAVDEPFGIIAFESGNPSRMTNLSWQHKEIDAAPYDITLLHINPDHAEQAILELPAEYFEGKYCIGYWAWELPEMPEEWQRCFRYVDEVWVPSRFVEEAIAVHAPVPVLRMPHSIEVCTDPAMDRDHFDLPRNAFLFLSMFDTHSRAERKNPFGAIDAFRRAFDPDDTAAHLALKVNNPTSEGLQLLREAIGEHNNISVLDAAHERIEVNSLLQCIDCLVSLHRAEGFGLPPAEAMALGKATIMTEWSGNTDYMTRDNCIGIPCTLIQLKEDHGPYRRGQYWADPDLVQAADAMQHLARDPELAQRLGANARRTIERHFSPEAVGRRMRRRLAAIRAHRERG